MGKKEMLDLIYDNLRIGLADAEFRLVRSDEGFVRKTAGGRQVLGVPFWDYWPLNFQFSLTVCIRLDAAENIFHLFSGSRRPSSSFTTITHLSYFTGGTDKYTMVTAEDVELVFANLSGLIRERVMPFFNKHMECQSLDKLVNSTELGIHTSQPPWGPAHAIILAYLARNPDFERLVAKHLAEMQLDPNGEHAFNRLVEYLRENEGGRVIRASAHSG